MLLAGDVIEATLFDENEQNYFATFEGQTLAIDKNSLESTIMKGQTIEGMFYVDQDSVARLQSPLPSVGFDQYAWCPVVMKRNDLGVFVDMGLFNKDLAVSYDSLPEDKEEWPNNGDRLMVSLVRDKKGRLWGELARTDYFQQIARRAPERLHNQDLECTIYRILEEGVQALSTEGYDVFIHESELNQSVRLGEKINVRVIAIHENGRLNGSMKPRAHEVIGDDAQLILAILERIPGHFLPLHDKSSPQAIQDQLGISKGQFKRAVGHLMKAKRITQEKGKGIQLIEHS